MTAILSWNNRVDSAAVTASSASGDLVANNVKVRRLRTPWRMTSDPGWLQADFGAAASVGALALYAENITASVSLRWRLSAVSAGAGELLDTGTVAFAGVAGIGMALHVVSPAVNARYLRVDISGSSGNFDVGRVWAGPVWTPSTNPKIGVGKGWADFTPIERGERTGAIFADPGYRWPTFDFGFDFLTDSDFASADDLSREAGTSGQVLVCLDTGASRWPRLTAFGRVAEINPILMSNFSTSAQWEKSFRFEGEG